MHVKLEHVIARNLAELRTEVRMTQSEVAQRMRSAGLGNWQQNRVTQIETLRRPVTFLEVLVLALVFEVPLARFFCGEDDVELPDGHAVPLQVLRQIAEGTVPERAWPVREAAPATDELRRIAQRLEIPVGALDWLAAQIYGAAFIEEREKRLGDTSGLSQRSAQTKRGNVTRGLVAEMKGYIRGLGGTEFILRTYQHNRRGAVPAQVRDKEDSH